MNIHIKIKQTTCTNLRNNYRFPRQNDQSFLIFVPFLGQARWQDRSFVARWIKQKMIPKSAKINPKNIQKSFQKTHGPIGYLVLEAHGPIGYPVLRHGGVLKATRAHRVSPLAWPLGPSWTVLGRKGWPTSLQAGSQNGGQIDNKSIQKSTIFFDASWNRHFSIFV